MVRSNDHLDEEEEGGKGGGGGGRPEKKRKEEEGMCGRRESARHRLFCARYFNSDLIQESRFLYPRLLEMQISNTFFDIKDVLYTFFNVFVLFITYCIGH